MGYKNITILVLFIFFSCTKENQENTIKEKSRVDNLSSAKNINDNNILFKDFPKLKYNGYKFLTKNIKKISLKDGKTYFLIPQEGMINFYNEDGEFDFICSVNSLYFDFAFCDFNQKLYVLSSDLKEIDLKEKSIKVVLKSNDYSKIQIDNQLIFLEGPLKTAIFNVVINKIIFETNNNVREGKKRIDVKKSILIDGESRIYNYKLINKDSVGGKWINQSNNLYNVQISKTGTYLYGTTNYYSNKEDNELIALYTKNGKIANRIKSKGGDIYEIGKYLVIEGSYYMQIIQKNNFKEIFEVEWDNNNSKFDYVIISDKNKFYIASNDSLFLCDEKFILKEYLGEYQKDFSTYYSPKNNLSNYFNLNETRLLILELGEGYFVDSLFEFKLKQEKLIEISDGKIEFMNKMIVIDRSIFRWSNTFLKKIRLLEKDYIFYDDLHKLVLLVENSINKENSPRKCFIYNEKGKMLKEFIVDSQIFKQMNKGFNPIRFTDNLEFVSFKDFILDIKNKQLIKIKYGVKNKCIDGDNLLLYQTGDSQIEIYDLRTNVKIDSILFKRNFSELSLSGDNNYLLLRLDLYSSTLLYDLENRRPICTFKFINGNNIFIKNYLNDYAGIIVETEDSFYYDNNDMDSDILLKSNPDIEFKSFNEFKNILKIKYGITFEKELQNYNNREHAH